MITAASINVPFRERKVKMALEEYNISLVTQKGGWFGLTGVELAGHFKKFSKILREDSPFVAVERDEEAFKALRADLKNIPEQSQRKIVMCNNDLFSQLRAIEAHRPNPKVPLFAYGHLDFCLTARTLAKPLSKDLYWLAEWKDLKDTFFFDLTFAERMDINKAFYFFMDEFVPLIFETSGWNISNPKNTKSFVHRYREPKNGSDMVNALYKVERRKPREKNS